MYRDRILEEENDDKTFHCFAFQYVRVMARGAQCAEDGPFFSTTPRAVIQNGIAVSQDILIMPDWLLIGMMMASLVLLMIVLVIGLVGFDSID